MASRLVWGSSLRWPWIFVVLAGLGRIYTGDHYPTDIVASIPLAIFYTWLIARTADHIWKIAGPRLVPKLFTRLPTLLKVK
jgi:membrane-associated phospholipid phosphatase